ncbi:MAG: amino acid racemase [Clostridia bacterium]|nr:amino acid racemase [Clostridia bacterium]
MNRIQRGQDAIGIVGGMGSVATAGFFSALIRAFPGEKEWDRPRIVVDNACQMPSRVRALLYGERRDELVSQLAGSIAGLVSLGCTDIVLCCNTSHVFLPEVLPLARAKCAGVPFRLRHILRILGDDLRGGGIGRVSLLATEGTFESGIYPAELMEYGIAVDYEGEGCYPQLRTLIEAVKRNRVDDVALSQFITLVNRQAQTDVVLGCTEFTILRDRLEERKSELRRLLHDPLEATIRRLVRDYMGEAGLEDDGSAEVRER